MELIDMKKYIFATIFLIANKLQTIGDQFLGEDMTTKQWLLTVVLSQTGDKPPTLSRVAGLMGISRQNVKQLALKLEEKEFVKIEKDEQDARILRLKLTEKSRVFWEERQEKDNQFVADLFMDFTEEEIDIVYSGIRKLIKKVISMEKNMAEKMEE
jgi:MarR family transcriptional regulator, transcriptional regulator for hemolysin